MARRSILYILILYFIILFPAAFGWAESAEEAYHGSSETALPFFTKRIHNISSLVGPNDAVIVSSPEHGILYAKNENRQLVPASTLKLLTSLAAMHYMGKAYRFPTRFYLDEENNLTIRGFGDPLLISEEIELISRKLAPILKAALADSDRPGNTPISTQGINDLILDDNFFLQPIRIPGRGLSLEPYDAPNGALCVNFNTVYFKSADNKIVTAEPQTPLLPLARNKAAGSGMQKGRITLSHRQGEVLQYAGEMFQHFLGTQSIQMAGKIRPGSVKEGKNRLVWEHTSSFTLERVIIMLLEYSNNFIANQLLLAMGARVEGGQGTLEKGVTAVKRYADRRIGVSGFEMVEGSGLSRNNRITALEMLKVLDAFESHYRFLTHEKRQFFKTGTLKGISTRVGYVVGKKTGRLYRFVIFLNTEGKSAEKVADVIESALVE